MCLFLLGSSRMRRLTLLVLVACAPAYAQQWSGILSPSRASAAWSQAGAGTIPARSTICTTLNAGASAAQINSAIASCPAGQVVQLSAGTYSVGSPGIVFNDKSDVTLRGAGPTQTIINFTGSNNCGGMGGDVCFINGDANWSGRRAIPPTGPVAMRRARRRSRCRRPRISRSARSSSSTR